MQLRAQQAFPASYPVIDSLEKKLALAAADTAKAHLFYRIGDELSVIDSAQAVANIYKGWALVKGNSFYTGLGHFYMGRIYMDYDLAQANRQFDTAISLLEKKNTPVSYFYQSRSWSNKGAIAQNNNNNNGFVAFLLDHAIPLAFKAGDSIRVAEIYTNIALPFMNHGSYDKAISYFQKSVKLFQQNLPKDLRQIDNFANLAKIAVLQNNYPEARTYLDSAAYILKLAPESIYAPNYYSIEATYFINRRHLAEAESSIDKGLKIAEKLNSLYDRRSLLYQKMRLRKEAGAITEARNILLQMYNAGMFYLENDRRQFYKDIASLEDALGNYKAAAQWLVRLNELSDSLYDQRTYSQIDSLETRYRFELKEQEVISLKNKAQTQKIVIWSSVIILLLAAALFTYLLRLRKSKADHEMQLLKRQQQEALTKALLEGEEKERARLARDLHDGLGGMLAGVKINLTNTLQENTSEEMSRVISQIDNSVTELRRIARNLMPQALLRSGLKTALSDLCQLTANEQLIVESRFMNITAHIPIQTQIIIYRIVQELLSNVIKHSDATEVYVQCSQSHDSFHITVEDNGKGIDTTKAKDPPGLGLENIRSRVEFLNGKLDICSKPGNGTITNIEIKLDDK